MFEDNQINLKSNRRRQWLTLSNDGRIYNQREWNKTLISKFNEVANTINEKTQRGQSNYIVCGSEILPTLGVALLDPTKTFTIMPSTLI